MKKVLIIATVYSHIAQFHQALIDKLKANNYEVHICGYDNLAVKNGLTINNVDKKFNLPFSRDPFSFNNIKCYKELKKILKKEKYDFIHCNTPVGGVLGRLAAKKLRSQGTKVFYTAHGFHFYKGSSLKSWLIYYPIEKLLAKYTDVIITINKEDYDLSKSKFKKCNGFLYINGVGVDEKKFSNCIDLRTRQNYEKEFNISNNDFVVVCIGELNDNKNQILAIDAMKKIVEKHKNVKLLILGNGPKKDYLQDKINEYNLGNNVKLLGYRTDVSNILCMANLGISCSLREGLGLNLIEELIAKLPIIAVYNRGHKEIVVNNYNGFLIKNDVDELVEKINLLYENKKLYNEIKNNCYDSAKKFFVNNSIELLSGIYGVKNKDE